MGCGKNEVMAHVGDVDTQGVLNHSDYSHLLLCRIITETGRCGALSGAHILFVVLVRGSILCALARSGIWHFFCAFFFSDGEQSHLLACKTSFTYQISAFTDISCSIIQITPVNPGLQSSFSFSTKYAQLHIPFS
jgi:hypothetical protein